MFWLTHWALGDAKVVLQVYFSNSFSKLVSAHPAQLVYVSATEQGLPLRRARVLGHVDLVPGHIDFCGAWLGKWFFSLGMYLFFQQYT